MRRRAAANVEGGSSLFTFLDGLICTMGALIVVLVVMVHQGKLQVQAAQVGVSPSAEDDLEVRRSDLEWRIGLLRESRDKTLAQLDDARQALGHLEDHARRLRSQLEEQDFAHGELQRAMAGEEREHEQSEAQVADAEARIAAARSELDEKMHSLGTQTDSYAIIPYHGNNQTRRRPIYIECSAKGVVFQPEGIVLTEEDFTGDLGPSNPLASGLRAAREHMIRTRGSKPGDDGMPYPLLLVRPDGIGAYLAARAAMGSWSTEFGYELIDQDWPIEFPAADPALTLAMREAISEGRLKQAYLVRNAPRLMRHGERPSFGPASGGGGLVRGDGSPLGGASSQVRNGSHGKQSAWVGNGYQGDGLVGLGTQPPRRGSGQGGGSRQGGTGAAGDDSLVGPRYGGSSGNDLSPSDGIGGLGGNRTAGGLANGDKRSRGNGQGGSGVSPYAAALEGLAQGGDGGGIEGSAASGQNGLGQSPGALRQGAGGQSGRSGSPNGGTTGVATVAAGLGPVEGSLANGNGGGTGQSGRGRIGRGQGAGGQGGSPGLSDVGSAPGVVTAVGGLGADDGQLTNGDPGGATQIGGGPASRGTNDGGQSGRPGSPIGGSAAGIATAAGGPGAGASPLTSGKPGGSGQTGSDPTERGQGVGGQRGKPGTLNGQFAADTSQVAGDGDGTGTDQTGTAGATNPQSAMQNPQSRRVPLEQRLPKNPGPHARYGYGSSADGVADAGDASGNDAQGDSATADSSSMGPASGTSSNAAQSALSRPGGQRSRVVKASTGTNGSSSGASSGSSSGGSGGGAGGASQPSQPGQPGGMPMPNMSFGQPPQSIAEHRGRNWANKGADDQRAKEAIVPIKAICDADHLSFLPERGSGQEIRVIKLGARTADSVNELVDAVWDQVDSWGTAGRGNYWRPKLVLEIEQGGERRFADLKALLADSGFDIEGRPRGPSRSKRPSRATSQWLRPFRAHPRTATP